VQSGVFFGQKWALYIIRDYTLFCRSLPGKSPMGSNSKSCIILYNCIIPNKCSTVLEQMFEQLLQKEVKMSKQSE
jgi:hypothetical protein